MGKRFCDTELVEKEWWQVLSPEHKSLWEYVRAKCDRAGVWAVNWRQAEFAVNATLDYDESVRVLAAQILVLRPGKWWLVEFIPFQYGVLSEKCPPHRSVLALVEHHGLADLLAKGYAKGFHTLSLPLPKGKPTLEEEEEAKEEKEDKGGVRGGAKRGGGCQNDSAGPSAASEPTTGAPNAGFPASTTHSTAAPTEPAGFAAWYAVYPKKRSKGDARKAWKTLKPCPELWSRMIVATKAQAASNDWTKERGKYIPLPATWLRAEKWDDEIGPTPLGHALKTLAQEPEPETPRAWVPPEGLAKESARWAKALEALKTQVDEENFDTWLKPMGYMGEKDGTYYFVVPSAYSRSWVVRYFSDRIKDVMELGEGEELAFEIDSAQFEAQGGEEEDDG